MKKQLVTTLLVCLFPILFTACVSSVLQGGPPTFSTEIKLLPPNAPFVATKSSVFPSWRNPKSGNVISIISDCDPNSAYSLSGLHHMVEDALTEVKIDTETNVTFQDKPAVQKKLVAELDGQPIEIRSISFRRKSCGYVSTLSGKVGTLDQDQDAFTKFNSGLKFE